MAKKSPRTRSKYTKTRKNGKTGKKRREKRTTCYYPQNKSLFTPATIASGVFPYLGTPLIIPIPTPAHATITNPRGSRRGYLSGGVVTGQTAQGPAGLLCHTWVALVHLERLQHREVTPGRDNGILQHTPDKREEGQGRPGQRGRKKCR